MTPRRARGPATGKTRVRADQSDAEAVSTRPATNGQAAERPPPSPWRASRERQHDREVKREAVIRAAAHAFNLKGYHNTSRDDMDAAREVTKPTVYFTL